MREFRGCVNQGLENFLAQKGWGVQLMFKRQQLSIIIRRIGVTNSRLFLFIFCELLHLIAALLWQGEEQCSAAQKCRGTEAAMHEIIMQKKHNEMLK